MWKFDENNNEILLLEVFNRSNYHIESTFVELDDTYWKFAIKQLENVIYD